MTENDAEYLRVLDGYQKVLKSLHDFLKLKGTEDSTDFEESWEEMTKTDDRKESSSSEKDA